MNAELRYGKAKYLSFVIWDTILLIISNIIALLLYKICFPEANYSYIQYTPIIIIMIIIDLTNTYLFNTLCRVLRRRKRKEIMEGAKHIGLSFVTLSVILFLSRSGFLFSRIIVIFAYILYFFLFVGFHIIWSEIVKRVGEKSRAETAILMTTDRFLNEGIKELRKINIDIRYLYLLKNIKKNEVEGISVVKTVEDASAAICWNMLDKVYIYGLDHQMVPVYLIKACREMNLKFDLVDFNYRIIDVATIQNEDPKYGSLSYLEGKRDIPFPIRRVYWITETEVDLHRGFHAHKLNCQLLYCPYGKIDIILDDGQEKTTVTLDKPSKGLLLMPGLWREMVWQQSGSVLCVLASEYYDASEYIRDYDEFIEYNNKYRASADPLSRSI